MTKLQILQNIIKWHGACQAPDGNYCQPKFCPISDGCSGDVTNKHLLMLAKNYLKEHQGWFSKKILKG